MVHLLLDRQRDRPLRCPSAVCGRRQRSSCRQQQSSVRCSRSRRGNGKESSGKGCVFAKSRQSNVVIAVMAAIIMLSTPAKTDVFHVGAFHQNRQKLHHRQSYPLPNVRQENSFIFSERSSKRTLYRLRQSSLDTRSPTMALSQSQAGGNDNHDVDDDSLVDPRTTKNKHGENINNENNAKDDDVGVVRNEEEGYYSYLDDLTPPPVNFARNSILFSENPSTKARNNKVLDVWRFCRQNLPPVFTGIWPYRAERAIRTTDANPIGALYNMVFVRTPVVAVAMTYLYQAIIDHHGLVMDLGFVGTGPTEINPILVIFVLAVILA